MNKFDRIYYSVLNENKIDEINFQMGLVKLLQNKEYKTISYEIAKVISYFNQYQRNEKLEMLIKKMKNKNVADKIIVIFKEKRHIVVNQSMLIEIIRYLLNNEKERNKIIQNVYEKEVNNYVAQKQLQRLLD